MPQSLDELIAGIDILLADLDAAEVEHSPGYRCCRRRAPAWGGELGDYAVLRQHDRRELQNDLMDLGATSLATTEADVRSKVLAARNVLCALRGDVGPWPLEAINEALDEGDTILRANSDAVFDSMRPGRPTRIMVTLPMEAAGDPALVAAFVDAGMDVARINCAHTDGGYRERESGDQRGVLVNAHGAVDEGKEQSVGSQHHPAMTAPAIRLASQLSEKLGYRSVTSRNAYAWTRSHQRPTPTT